MSKLLAGVVICWIVGCFGAAMYGMVSNNVGLFAVGAFGLAVPALLAGGGGPWGK